ncbi:MAG: iron-containing alcohol dehydrogenase [Armatimonadetes bacterium]|nr:iron-containing alcohol dehydrogenase [Armatimonadota bacterium]
MWTYKQPTEIRFGTGERKALPEVVARLGKRPIVVTDTGIRGLPTTAEIIEMLGPDTPVFSEVEPNPTVSSVDRLAETINARSSDVVVALGGGSALDCAKAACSVALQGVPTRRYHSEGAVFDSRRLPLIAMPTTAGTGSEVTPVSVLDDPEKGVKAPVVHDNFYPSVAVVDPELTLTMPAHVTAATGFDALSHAIEGYWSKNHQPICDLMALEAAGLFFKHFPNVLTDGSNLEAREGMSKVALLAGLAFQLPRTASVHACSYPLSSEYHLPHGVACAMTLDHFVRFNGDAMGERGVALARAGGFADMPALADAIAGLKSRSGLVTNLSEAGVTEGELDALVQASFHPIMNNNPRRVCAEDLRQLYVQML